MIVIAAVMKAKEGSGDELEKVLKKYLPKFAKDPGCIEYRGNRRVDNPNLFLIYEKYEDKEALSFHASTPHFKEMFQEMKPFIDGPADIVRYKEIG